MGESDTIDDQYIEETKFEYIDEDQLRHSETEGMNEAIGFEIAHQLKRIADHLEHYIRKRA